MEIIEGKQNGLYVYNNYIYYKDNRYDHIYRCSRRRTEKCSAVLRKEGESYSLKHRHNHSEEQYIAEIHKMKKEMVRLCKETTKASKNIFDTVSCNNLRVAPYISYNSSYNISYNSMKSILSRERAKSRPNIPNDLHALQKQLETYIPISNIYKGYATSSDNKIALIFSNDVLLNVLSEACEIFVDGTFSIVPKKPSMAQLYTIHIRYIDTGIATVFVLCETRSASLYKAMWEKIVSLAPGLNKNLKFIMADYEKAAISAMSEQFPTVAIYGCWFHYSQALLRKWRRLGLDDAPRELLSMAKTMALVPSDLFEESLNIMQIFSNTLTNKYPAITDFMQYVRNTWLPIASKVSVYGCPNRTNNLVESFYGSVIKQLRPISLNLWKFLEYTENDCVYDNNIVTMRNEGYEVNDCISTDILTLEYVENDCAHDNNIVTMRNEGYEVNDCISTDILTLEYVENDCAHDNNIVTMRNEGYEINDCISSDILTKKVSGKEEINNNNSSIKNMKKVKIPLSRVDNIPQKRRRIPLRNKTNVDNSSKTTTNKTSLLTKKIAVTQNGRNRRTCKNKHK